MRDDGIYSTTQWRKVRKLVLIRDKYQCQIRKEKCTNKATEVDHIIPWRDGGPKYEMSNLRAACKSCNSSLGTTNKHYHGWKRSKTRITLVLDGREIRAGDDDLILNFDSLVTILGSKSAARICWDALLRLISRGELNVNKIWIITDEPNAEDLYPHHVKLGGVYGESQSSRW